MTRSPDDWVGHDLGRRRVSWTDRDAILYALSVGARADQLALVFEERLRVLPTFALTLAQWAPDALGAAGAFDPTRAVHGSQRLEVLAPLPASGDLEMTAKVSGVWDKSAGAVFDVEVGSELFVATWSILALGRGGFGGERGPVRPPESAEEPVWSKVVEIPENAAALYGLNGDPTAGTFMTGFFPIMMFALPAAALAIWHEARPAHRKAVGGIMLSGALTSFLTGVTEPLEFAFMFVAWPLYALHAVLTGTSHALVNALGIRDGFGFSAGLFDYVLNFGIATNPLWLIPIGLGYAAVYYLLFRLVIRRWNLRTPGREEEGEESAAEGDTRA
jgi:phosphotransferase system  glucose/maltose/N-acetylglucosamine-specific IIC component